MLSSSGSSGTGMITFAVGVGNPCSLAGTSLTALSGTGTCSVTATIAADNNYNAASSSAVTVMLQRANQTILVSAPSSKIFGDADFSVSAIAPSGFTVTFAGTTPSICTVTDNGNGSASVHIVAAGARSLTASQSGNVNFNAANVIAPITIYPARIQTVLSITNGKYPTSAYGDTVVLSAQVTDIDHSNAPLNGIGFIELKVFAQESETSSIGSGSGLGSRLTNWICRMQSAHFRRDFV